MNRFFLGAVVVVLSGCFGSCSFRKLVAGKKPEVYVWNADSVARMDSAAKVLAADSAALVVDSAAILHKMVDEVTPLWTSRLQYRTFSGKAKMHMEAPDDKQDFTAHFRIKKDSIIWINITALGGISFARIYVTPDSFFLLNHLQKTAMCIPLASAAKILPARIDFASLQNLITGEPLRDGEITGVANAADKWVLHVEDTSYIQEVTYSKGDSTMSAAQLLTYAPNGPKAITRYNKYQRADGRRVSTDRVLNLQNGNDFYKLEMDFNKVNFDEQLEFPFSIPKNYKINPPQEGH